MRPHRCTFPHIRTTHVSTLMPLGSRAATSCQRLLIPLEPDLRQDQPPAHARMQDPSRGLSDFLEPSMAQLPDSLAMRPASPASSSRGVTAASSPCALLEHRHGPVRPSLPPILYIYILPWGFVCTPGSSLGWGIPRSTRAGWSTVVGPLHIPSFCSPAAREAMSSPC